jgi:hypothetical protein
MHRGKQQPCPPLWPRSIILVGIPDLLVSTKRLVQLHHYPHLLVVPILGQASGDAEEELLITGLKHGS